MTKRKLSQETVNEAMVIAKATQKPGQTKEQTKLIAQGIQHGIEQYKKQQKIKARERSKAQKQVSKQRQQLDSTPPMPIDLPATPPEKAKPNLLPWVLLGISWLGFIAYIITNS
ncbi:DUF2956 domain-containing protein [Thaumasiovibrio sp. DFM-14]|uniref:DUF2956 domain-containing protein n=1 Tax=Thaumasiovibrio sp. DFM-14 TaxID=3384792 RepID=UPI0039A0DF50